MTDTLEDTAQRIADRGRDALLERLRPAFKDAAAKHADALQLSDEQLEQMVQRAADRADGLQWRRALAGVATEELGIGLGEALSHPAVARAQAIVGAPSYEDSLGAVGSRRRAPAPSQAREPDAAEPEPDAPNQSPTRPNQSPSRPNQSPTRPNQSPTRPNRSRSRPRSPSPSNRSPSQSNRSHSRPQSSSQYPRPSRRPSRAAEATMQDPPAVEPTPIAPQDVAPVAATDDAENEMVRLAVIHLGGVANLTTGERDIELRISHYGLDIVRGSEEPLGRLTWSDIQTLSVPPARGLRRRRRESRAHLVIHTDHGDASFEVPAVAPDELREHLAPVVERYGPARRGTLSL